MRSERETSLDLMSSTCLSWSFFSKRHCVISWVATILMRAIIDDHAGRLWPAGASSLAPEIERRTSHFTQS